LETSAIRLGFIEFHSSIKTLLFTFFTNFTLVFFLETEHTANSTNCVEAFSALDEKFKEFIAKHKTESDALISQFTDQIKIIKGIDKKNSICKFFCKLTHFFQLTLFFHQMSIQSWPSVVAVNLKKVKTLATQG
jgi:hypothetical protein